MKAELDAELARLNAAVVEACAVRKKWMDENMVHYAKFKVGDEIFDRDTGKLLGVVTELYRFWGNQNDPRYDTSMSIEYRYRVEGERYGYIDNTSRHGSYTNWAFITRAERDADLAAKLEQSRYEATDEGKAEKKRLKEYFGSPEYKETQRWAFEAMGRAMRSAYVANATATPQQGATLETPLPSQE